MTTYYCNLGADFADRTGEQAQSVNTPYCGPGGWQSAVTGWGNATKLGAGDELRCWGTANLKRWVKLTCGKDIAAAGWLAGHRVQDNAGGAVWQGTLVVAVTTAAYVHLDSAYTYDSVNTANGINNVTLADTTTLSARAIEALKFNGNSGTVAGGRIRFLATNASGVEDGTPVIVDGRVGGTGTAAASCIIFDGQSRGILRRWQVQNASSHGGTWGAASDLWRIAHCAFISNGGYGATTGANLRATWYRCDFSYNTTGGISSARPPSNSVGGLWACRFSNNSGPGFLASLYSIPVVGCLIYANTGDLARYLDYAAGCTLYQCVLDGSTDGIDLAAGPTAGDWMVWACRLTALTGVAIKAHADLDSCWEDHNYFDDNGMDKSGGVFGGDNDQADIDGAPNYGYVDRAGADFNLAPTATMRSVPVTVP